MLFIKKLPCNSIDFLTRIVILEAKGSNCVNEWLVVKPYCLSIDDY